MRITFIFTSILSLLIIFILSFWKEEAWFLLWIIVPFIGVGLYDMLQVKHSLRRNFPLIGRGRWFMEFVRPFIRQYFIESDIDGAPVNRMF